MNQTTALDILKSGENVFLTGQAGSGKTYVLNQYIDYLQRRGVSVSVTASTGIAATHIGGSTIHSWSGLGITANIADHQIDAMRDKKYLISRFNDVKVLLIDEISMISPELLDSVNRVLQAFKENDEPFGGIQMIVSGDFFQLPPVSRNQTEERFAWSARVWDDAGFSVCYLTEQFRQESDSSLNVLLNEIRDGEVSEQSMELLRGRYRKDPDIEVEATKLYTHNADVDTINQHAHDALPGYGKRFEMSHKGNTKLVAGLEKGTLAHGVLDLKKDAHVMFVKNNYEKGYMNGSMGKVVGFSDAGWPLVELVDDRVIEAEPETWSLEENGAVLASITQIPLRLAWAITVHKSQGMSLDAAEIDLSKSFESGQGYVALSRLRSIEGLKLMGLNPQALLIDEEIRNKDQYFRTEASNDEMRFIKKSEEEKEELFENFLELVEARTEEEVAVEYEQMKATASMKSRYGISETYLETAELVREEYDVEEMAVTREISEDTIFKHLAVLQEQMQDLSFDYLRPPDKTIEQVAEARRSIMRGKNPEHFTEDGSVKLKALFVSLDEKVPYDDIKLSLLFI